MDAQDITPEAADKIYGQLRPSFEYLAALQARMEERRFFGSDRLYLEVKAARDTMQLLCNDLHAIACHNFYPRIEPKK
jgi:hypothetical protein